MQKVLYWKYFCIAPYIGKKAWELYFENGQEPVKGKTKTKQKTHQSDCSTTMDTGPL